MGQLLEIVTPLHQATQRDYIARMQDEKVHCMLIAKQYEKDYWDGSRRYGYGGYKYIPARWKQVAQNLIDTYGLKSGSKVLDVGCGKGFLLYEMLLIEPKLKIAGFDISQYAIDNSKKEIKPFLSVGNAEENFPYKEKEFDLVISLASLHNLTLERLSKSLQEINRVGKQGYIMNESFRNVQEFFNCQCWSLTCQTFLNPEDWIWFFKKNNYSGDYEFIFFE